MPSADAAAGVAEAHIPQLDQARLFGSKIVTQVVPMAAFYVAEEHRQHFLDRNPDNPYIVRQDIPKIDSLQP